MHRMAVLLCVRVRVCIFRICASCAQTCCRCDFTCILRTEHEMGSLCLCHSQMGDAVLPVMLMPEEAALILDQGLASLSALLPSHPAHSQRAKLHENSCDSSSGCGPVVDEGGTGRQVTGARITIPHVPPPDGAAELDVGGFSLFTLYRADNGAHEWGLKGSGPHGNVFRDLGDKSDVLHGSGMQGEQTQMQESARIGNRIEEGSGCIGGGVEASRPGYCGEWTHMWAYPTTEVCT